MRWTRQTAGVARDRADGIGGVHRALRRAGNQSRWRMLRFDVLEVGATIHKVGCWMRLAYGSRRDAGCVLTGQEMLEYADL